MRWIALPFAAVYLLVLVVNLRDLIGQTYLNADAASAPVIASLIGDAPVDRVVTLATNPWYESLWFMQLTAGLPAHRQIWEAGPIAFTMLAIALVVWTAARVLGRWEASITGVLLLCAGGALYAWITPNTHGPAFTHSCVLGAALVWWVARHRPMGGGLLAVSAAGLAAVTVVGVATDSLLVVSGVVPFMAAAAVVWSHTRTEAAARVAAAALAVSVVSVGGGAVLANYMETHARIVPTGLRLAFVSHEQLVSTMTKFVDDFALLGNGEFFGRNVDALAVLALGSGLLTLGALLIVTRGTTEWLRGGDGRGNPALTAYVVFWAVSLIAVVGAYVVTSVPLNQGGTSRYLISAYCAVAALVPLALLGRRSALALSTALFAALASVWAINNFNKPDSSMAQTWGQVAGYARLHRLKYGYTGYWDAAPLTWASRMSVQTFPVWMCQLPRRALCPVALHTISSWYRPRPNTPSFLLTHPGIESTVDNPDPAFGKPRAVVPFPNNVTMFVYDYDIAAKLAR